MKYDITPNTNNRSRNTDHLRPCYLGHIRRGADSFSCLFGFQVRVGASSERQKPKNIWHLRAGHTIQRVQSF